ncbi:hypothetical protein [Maridesulfovibrio hydrothermalis]|nr:hypothetical protein [Maridesulfovibrio hydrothermalis]
MNIKKYNSYLFGLILVLFVISTSGCASINPFADSIPEYDLDGEHELRLDLMPGEVIAFEMRNPGSGGYQFDGITFNPKLVTLDKFNIVEPDSGMLGDFGRWRFEFTMVGIGDTPVIINIKRAGDKQRDAYKIINLSITEDGPPFFEW